MLFAAAGKLPRYRGIVSGGGGKVKPIYAETFRWGDFPTCS